MISEDGPFRCQTVCRVTREEAFNQKWLDEAVTPIDEYVQKGAKTSSEDVRVHRHVVKGIRAEARQIEQGRLREVWLQRIAEVVSSSRPESSEGKTILGSAEQGSRRSWPSLN